MEILMILTGLFVIWLSIALIVYACQSKPKCKGSAAFWFLYPFKFLGNIDL